MPQPVQALWRRPDLAQQPMAAVAPNQVAKIVTAKSRKPSHQQHPADGEVTTDREQRGAYQQALTRRWDAKSLKSNCGTKSRVAIVAKPRFGSGQQMGKFTHGARRLLRS